ncbi:MAG: diguanylate cyclase [Nitrospirae bacterium]|nr:diguanylate cyclase [Nitrospirota bacterium]
MKILVVEDDLVTRKLLEKTIRGWGHEVIAAENGLIAWEIFQKEEIKFIIADWMMPEMDGITLCKNIRSLNKAGYIYFILLTGKDKKEEIVEGLEAGADDYVAKPFNLSELKVRVSAGERILDLEKELHKKNNELSRINVKLEEISMTDSLMEIGNRRAFYEAIKKSHHRACRYLQHYGLIMCDIDNFKNYNDTYGHIEGDTLLKKVADTLKSAIRLSDDIFRWGGEEIVVIVHEQNKPQTKLVAEKLRQAIESLKFEHKGCARGYLTISCGVAAFNENDKNNQWKDILDRADKALYIAKQSGRNRVCIPTDKVEPEPSS